MTYKIVNNIYLFEYNYTLIRSQMERVVMS